MKTISLESKIIVYESRDEIPSDILRLIGEAEEAAKRAYAAYSQFQVGAAILMNNGKVVTGSNQENAVYPCGLCAERTAAFAASALYPEVPFSRIAVTAINPVTPLKIPVSPCGSCRQVLYEYEQKFGQPIEVILSGQEGPVYHLRCVADLLPYTFHAGFLP
ncbi:MAG: cytidine deaminase [Bacteroidales bacterium]|jgi:cytidine deaminase|nr:cytidine deaminase [Bacteroidales bacterium]MCR5550055.1 cytidine deaminase [Bacteroidales bacterium]